VLAWTNLQPERIGKRFPLGHHLEEALETGLAEAEFESLGEAEDEAESKLGIDNVVEVYAPIRTGKRIVGAYEIYSDAAPVERSIAGHKRQIWVGTAAVFGALWVLLFLLVRGASRVLRRQTETLRERSQALMDSYRRLEESSLEAVESLNATVEAKDPYTAGHSQRVQELALALGEQLGLGAQSLDALRFGALFHDIGKLAVPDAVLTKPERLTHDEYELIKRHSADGAHIVGKLGRLRPAVPVIHHHHERWDGDGYPDRLAGEEIPVEAAIVGLCDAWDAMTTDRPYHRALSFEEAFAEVRRGRGTQFHPDVVDAFVVLARQGRVRSGSEAEQPGAPALAEAG
jgi:putative nucleotidyltransferase with HDIG domain